MVTESDPPREWLEADGLGGYASGTAAGIRTRRYHGLLTAARKPPVDRVLLVAGFDAFVRTRDREIPVSAQRYAPDVVAPDGHRYHTAFRAEPWPTREYGLPDGTVLVEEILIPRGHAAVVLRFSARHAGPPPCRLRLRPFLAGRVSHHLLRESPRETPAAAPAGTRIVFPMPAAFPGVAALASGGFHPEPHWYRRFLLVEERARGYDHEEDLFAPGEFRFDLDQGPAALIFAAETELAEGFFETDDALALAETLAAGERLRRASFLCPLERAAEAYVVRRGAGRSIIAGYPWFADWGRDTFIALRGLLLAGGRFDEAAEVLSAWATAVSDGMVPNRFDDGAGAPADNAADASLWFVIVARELIDAAAAAGHALPGDTVRRLGAASLAILRAHVHGVRHGIRCDGDGLLAAGEPGVQLTWMDAKIGDHVVTPRMGKPVEVQALWLNALKAGARLSSTFDGLFRRGLASFRERFWNADRGCLYDVIDCDHRPGAVDGSLRPNQILAIGGLPMPLLEGERARAVVDVVERHLVTPMGLRSLAPGEPGYRGRCEGDLASRDHAYHMGTVWPWLIGPFLEAWVGVRGGSAAIREEALARFLAPLLDLAGRSGGHLPEIFDGDAPHSPRGAPFQAWSVGEVLRASRWLRADQRSRAPTSGVPPAGRGED